MENIEIIRKIDELGRIVLPLELRQALELNKNTPVQIRLDIEKQQIIIHKEKPGCTFCGNENNLIPHKGKNICTDCIAESSAKKK